MENCIRCNFQTNSVSIKNIPAQHNSLGSDGVKFIKLQNYHCECNAKKINDGFS
jgi:hypothetical protein